MEQSQVPFKLPTLRELKSLDERQLCKIFFELERHRANELLDAAEDYTDRIGRIEKDYNSDFQTLADVLAKVRSKTT